MFKSANAVHIFDATLSPENAHKRGYEYIDDIILDKRQTSTRDLLKILEDNNFKLGIPSRNENAFYGVYIPKDQMHLSK